MFLLSGCYVTRLALHQNDLFNDRRPIASLIEDPLTPEKLRQRLIVARRILQFAAAQGLNTSDAYRYYVDTKEPVVSYIVQAAEADRLVAKTWWFPVVGRVPYLGFFNKSERDDEAVALAGQGLDVHKGAASAFSSLGWFEDPLFSSMLVRSEADLAHLLLHELTHRTYWSPGSAEFNENLAEYAGIELAKEYLRTYGSREDVAKFTAKLEDRRLFKPWLESLRKELEVLYGQTPRLPMTELLQKKAAIFAKYQNPPLRPAFTVVDYVKGEDWNNAAVLANALYFPDTDVFAKAHACLKSQRMIDFLDELQRLTDATDGDPFKALEAMCRASAGIPVRRRLASTSCDHDRQAITVQGSKSYSTSLTS